MNKLKSFFQQQIFPGCYASYVNNKFISKDYEKSKNDFSVDVSEVAKKKKYIKQIKIDLENQLERKKRIEDKAKSLLFVIAVAVTAIAFSLNYLNSLIINVYQTISIVLVFLSIIYLVIGSIRALQILNIKEFNILQAEIEINKDDNRYILKEKKMILIT